MKKILIVLLMLISSTGFSQVETGWTFLVEAGSSLTTLKPKQPTIITLLHHVPTETEPGYTTKEGAAFVPTSNFSVIMGSAGYQFNPFLFLGAGVGYKSAYDKSMRELPVFGDIRLDFLNKNLSPTLAFKGGYNLSANIFGDLSAGIRYNLRPNTSVMINLAITNYQYEYTIISGTAENFKINNYFLQFRTGLIF